MKIKFYTLGGTIDKVYFDAMSRYEVGPPRAKEILKEARVNFEYSIKSLAKKDSLDMTDTDRKRLADALLADDCDRIVVTHGTDTMVDTAMALKAVKDKTIVLTGAMEPAGFKSSDATFNLGFAVAAVQTLLPGVYITISGRVFDPARVRKNRDLKQFEET